FRIFNTIILYTIFRWVWQFNPSPWAPTVTLTTAPLAFVNFIAIKQFAEGLIILLAAHVLLNFRIFQKILLIERKSQVKTGYIISAFLLFGFVFWFISGFSDYLYSSDKLQFLLSHQNPSLAETLALQVPGYELFTRILFILTCLVAGLVVSKYVLKFKESEAAREEAYKIVNKSNSVAFLWENTEGWPVEFVSQNVQKLFGYSAEDFVSGNISYLATIHPEDQKRIFDEVAVFSEKKDSQDFEHEPYRIITKNNEVKWVSDSTYIRRDDQGKITHYQGIVEDITKRKQAEELLSEEKERLAVTLRSIGDGVITTDTAGNIVLMNKIAEKLTGWSQEEAFNRPLTEVFHIINEKTRKRCENPVEKVLSSGKIIGLANHTALIAKDGTERSIADSGAPIRDKESRIIGVVLVFRDVTLKNQMEEELLKVKKLESVSVLAGGIAHDFNNILAGILGNIELTLLDANLKPKTQKFLTEAKKASVRAKDLTQQLLTFAKGGEPVKETTSLSEIMRDSAEFVLHGSNVACQYHIPDDLWFVEIDKGQMSQVIQNLIINAKHAMPAGGIINITCKNILSSATESIFLPRKNNYIRVTISDSGIGIPENVIDKIFDPY
ncbi:MAG: PAS domain S-box protein, partial [Desulfobulbaceae bacterium]|nr:PAS domain S-box protein [Desulfobulbaceae bacterium]